MQLKQEQTALLDTFCNNLKDKLNVIKDKINNAQKIAVIGHVNPDGDCIACQLGMKLGLSTLGKNVSVINDGPFDTAYSRAYQDRFLNSSDIQSDFDLYIIVDVSSCDRIALDKNLFDNSRCVLIDHHNADPDFADCKWIDTNFVSASEMVFILLYFLNVDINATLAQTLLDGILADNGFYQHIRIHKYDSLYFTYLLVALGADPNLSYHKMFCNNTLDTEKLFGRLLERLETLCQGKIIYCYITKSDRNIGGTNIDFSSGMMFSQMLSIKGIKVAIFFKVDDDKVNVSLRSTDDIDVSVIARHFGGGGHKVASGCTIEGSLDYAKNAVLNEVCQLF